MSLIDAVAPPASNPDQGVAWHYGDPHREQRELVAGKAAVDLSNRGVVTVSGADRLMWLHSLTTQHVDALSPGSSSLALILSPHGHVEHELHLIDDGERTWIIVAPDSAASLIAYLTSMQFMLRVSVLDVSDEFGVVWEPSTEIDPVHPTWLEPEEFSGRGTVDSGSDRGGDASKYVPSRPDCLVGREVIVPRTDLAERLAQSESLSGSWALEALRVAAAVPRIGLETDHRTLPHEVGWIGPGVHLAKGCYRGQEAVARVHNLGHPPRRLVLLHLDGSDQSLPAHGDDVIVDDKVVGWIGTAAWHYESGPIATAIVRRNTAPTRSASVRSADGEIAASIEDVVVS